MTREQLFERVNALWDQTGDMTAGEVMQFLDLDPDDIEDIFKHIEVSGGSPFIRSEGYPGAGAFIAGFMMGFGVRSLT